MGKVLKGVATLGATALGGPLAGAAVGGGLGAVEHNQKRGEYNRQKELAAKTAQYSPWTGLNAMSFMPKQSPNAFQDIGGGAFGGAMQGMEWDKAAGADAAKKAAESVQGAQRVGTMGGNTPWGQMAQSPGSTQFAGGFEAAPTLFNPMKSQSPWGQMRS